MPAARAMTCCAPANEAGFVVTHNPTQRNLFHVTVSYPGDWDAAVAARFRERFDAPIGE
jgi:hypothetical protein